MKKMKVIYLVVVFALIVVSVIMFSGIACAGPLHDAASAGNIGKVRQLLKQGADVNARNEWQGTPLHYAALNGHTEVARLLIENGADVNAKNYIKFTPLHTAALGDNIEVAKLLIENGADVNARDQSGDTPAKWANKYNTELVAVLRGGGSTVGKYNAASPSSPRASAVPEGFMEIPWGASRNQIIKAMNERGCQQITNNNPETLEFHKGNFAGVTCSRLYFNLRENSLYEGSAYGCARSEYHEFTQDKFNQIVKMLSGKYGPPKRGSGIRRGEDTVNKNYCAGLKLTFDFADWDLVDSRSNKYSIRMRKGDSTFYTFDGSERDACRMDFSISYSAESLKQQLGKKGY